MSIKEDREVFIENANVTITSFPSGIEDLKAELLALKNRVSELEAKTRLISIDEENGILKVGRRTYFFSR
jgi:hypothetical protein